MELGKKTRIFHIVNAVGTGGTELIILKLCEALDERLFEQVVCTVEPTLPFANGSKPRIISLNRAASRARLLVWHFARLFARERPDVVHSRAWGAIEAVLGARLARVPLVIHSEHGRDIRTVYGLPFRNRLFRRLCYSCADYVFAVSTELGSYYADQLCIPSGRIGLIRNGIDTERFRPDESVRIRVRNWLSLAPEILAVGCVGRLDPIKDHETLLKAADIVLTQGMNAKLYIVGDGVARVALQALVQSRPALARQVVFSGVVQNVPEWLNAFDLFVLPSLSEGMSNTILEAMATGLPIVTTVEAGGELIEDGVTGLLFPAKDVNALATALRSLCSSPELRATLGRRARRHAQSAFGLTHMLEQYRQLYAGKFPGQETVSDLSHSGTTSSPTLPI
jgi:sugar transferase (PEP-CTERM/EpsH1 system associated)